MKLSEAMRLGAMISPQSRAGIQETRDGVRHTCALGAALEASGALKPTPTTGPGLNHRGSATSDFGYNVCPEWYHLLESYQLHPEFLIKSKVQLVRIISSLNDRYGWTRERIADWVETIENQQEQANPIEVDEAVQV
jgi:hypothetical protein